MTERYDDEIELIELIRIIWQRKWLVILLPIFAAILAYGISFFMTPTYSSTVKIVLSNMGDPIYSNPLAAKEEILSADTLTPIMERLKLKYKTVDEFKKTIEVTAQKDQNILQVDVFYSDAKTAQAIAAEIGKVFKEKSDQVFLAKKKLVEDLLATLKEQKDLASKSLDRNRAALTAIETNGNLTNEEKDISRVRLLDYIVRDEAYIKDSISRIQDAEMRLIDMKEAQFVENATLPDRPDSPKKALNAVIAFVVGLMFALLLVFLIEYFSKNMHRLRGKEENMGLSS
ncbi:YveK family protein [Thermicanus aegyptius]|uniref:YveK family protein n=1 Tax=Thermicanus aegyptius TaxID=94009 RepID=UPI0004012EAD|nr:Wzz/FepE/Etk N-terminal domain-containing protein [Thermicanus aegyptius]